MRLRSVKAVVRLRGDHRKHFTLTSTQRRRPEHDGSVKFHRSIHRPRGLMTCTMCHTRPARSIVRSNSFLRKPVASSTGSNRI